MSRNPSEFFGSATVLHRIGFESPQIVNWAIVLVSDIEDMARYLNSMYHVLSLLYRQGRVYNYTTILYTVLFSASTISALALADVRSVHHSAARECLACCWSQASTAIYVLPYGSMRNYSSQESNLAENSFQSWKIP